MRWKTRLGARHIPRQPAFVCGANIGQRYWAEAFPADDGFVADAADRDAVRVCRRKLALDAGDDFFRMINMHGQHVARLILAEQLRRRPVAAQHDAMAPMTAPSRLLRRRCRPR